MVFSILQLKLFQRPMNKPFHTRIHTHTCSVSCFSFRLQILIISVIFVCPCFAELSAFHIDSAKCKCLDNRLGLRAIRCKWFFGRSFTRIGQPSIGRWSWMVHIARASRIKFTHSTYRKKNATCKPDIFIWTYTQWYKQLFPRPWFKLIPVNRIMKLFLVHSLSLASFFVGLSFSVRLFFFLLLPIVPVVCSLNYINLVSTVILVGIYFVLDRSISIYISYSTELFPFVTIQFLRNENRPINGTPSTYTHTHMWTYHLFNSHFCLHFIFSHNYHNNFPCARIWNHNELKSETTNRNGVIFESVPTIVRNICKK